MLELTQLTIPIAEMAETLHEQRRASRSLVEQARDQLRSHALVTDHLREKLAMATRADTSWRGADPLGERLDERRLLPEPAPLATLLASDGSQVYPDPHGIALYYLLNVGTIVLRQGSGEAPDTASCCQLFYRDQDLYDGGERLIETDQINALRDLRELKALVQLAEAERARLGGDLGPLLIALADGPLLLWMPQRLTDVQQEQRVGEFARELSTLKRDHAVPVGYVDRPRSANVLRLLHLAELPADQISKERLRQENPYRSLSDRLLFDDLEPGQRTALFAATSEINDTYGQQGHRIYFCYLNVAASRQQEARIVRVEVPQWIARDQDRLDAALAAVRADCRLTGYPYVLARAHELALVSHQEREAFEQMLRVEMMRLSLPIAESAKQRQKRWLSGRR